MTTGMIIPDCELVRALKFLQKSMMLTPAWPSAGPTGGAGVAAPAGICSLICPMTFLAIFSSFSGSHLRSSPCSCPHRLRRPVEAHSKRLSDRPPHPLIPLPTPPGGKGTPPPSLSKWRFFLLDLLHLREVELDRRLPAEDRDHHLQGVAVEVDVVDHPGEVVEGAVGDPHRLRLLEHVLRLRLLLRGHHLLEDLVDLVLGERRRLAAGPHEA